MFHLFLSISISLWGFASLANFPFWPTNAYLCRLGLIRPEIWMSIYEACYFHYLLSLVYKFRSRETQTKGA